VITVKSQREASGAITSAVSVTEKTGPALNAKITSRNGEKGSVTWQNGPVLSVVPKLVAAEVFQPIPASAPKKVSRQPINSGPAKVADGVAKFYVGNLNRPKALRVARSALVSKARNNPRTNVKLLPGAKMMVVRGTREDIARVNQALLKL
jgi:hypothetical protein